MPRSPAFALLLIVAAASGLHGPTAAAAATQDGAYAVLAGGAARVEHDCGFYLDCERTTSGVLRAALGWRSGSWSAEAWVLGFGNSAVGDAYVSQTLQLRAWGGVAAWHWTMSDQADVQWRLGLLRMRHERTGDGVVTRTAPLIGLAWVQTVTPHSQLELAWDLTRADGNNVSTTFLYVLTAGLRLRF